MQSLQMLVKDSDPYHQNLDILNKTETLLNSDAKLSRTAVTTLHMLRVRQIQSQD